MEALRESLDRGTVVFAVRAAMQRGEDVTVSGVAREAGLPAHRVEPVLRQMSGRVVNGFPEMMERHED